MPNLAPDDVQGFCNVDVCAQEWTPQVLQLEYKLANFSRAYISEKALALAHCPHFDTATDLLHSPPRHMKASKQTKADSKSATPFHKVAKCLYSKLTVQHYVAPTFSHSLASLLKPTSRHKFIQMDPLFSVAGNCTRHVKLEHSNKLTYSGQIATVMVVLAPQQPLHATKHSRKIPHRCMVTAKHINLSC